MIAKELSLVVKELSLVVKELYLCKIEVFLSAREVFLGGRLERVNVLDLWGELGKFIYRKGEYMGWTIYQSKQVVPAFSKIENRVEE